MSEDKSLVVVPNFGHLLNKEVRIIALNNIFNFRNNVEVDKLLDILSYFLIQLGFLIDGWLGRGGNIKLIDEPE